MTSVWAWIAALCIATGCDKPTRRHLDLELVRVIPNAKLRTDRVDDGAFAATATFVLVDAENNSSDGAYVTLAGQLGDARGQLVSELKPQSLWIPAGESRTFALVDRERSPRPTASTARIQVRGATIPAQPPAVDVVSIREVEDRGKLIVRGTVRNATTRPGQIMVIASFHAADGQPVTRPFSVLHLPAQSVQDVQFVSTVGATRSAMYIGEVNF